jgi:hypothetical protein
MFVFPMLINMVSLFVGSFHGQQLELATICAESAVAGITNLPVFRRVQWLGAAQVFASEFIHCVKIRESLKEFPLNVVRGANDCGR